MERKVKQWIPFWPTKSKPDCPDISISLAPVAKLKIPHWAILPINVVKQVHISANCRETNLVCHLWNKRMKKVVQKEGLSSEIWYQTLFVVNYHTWNLMVMKATFQQSSRRILQSSSEVKNSLTSLASLEQGTHSHVPLFLPNVDRITKKLKF